MKLTGKKYDKSRSSNLTTNEKCAMQQHGVSDDCPRRRMNITQNLQQETWGGGGERPARL
jgi:DNA-binding protein H-NS